LITFKYAPQDLQVLESPSLAVLLMLICVSHSGQYVDAIATLHIPG